MITRIKARERPSLLSPPNHPVATTRKERESSSTTSPYSLSNEDMNHLTEEFDELEELTTSGRTYEELVSASSAQQQNSQRKQSSGMAGQQQQHPRDSMMSEETEEDSEDPSKKYGRQSLGFMLGRNSLSNWSTVGGGLLNDEDEGDNHDEDGIPSSVHMDQMNTGRKSNVSRHSLGGRNSLSLDTPNFMNASHVNVSQRRSNHVQNSRVTQGSNGNARLSRPSHKMAHGGGRAQSLNLSHISSSSSSGLDASREDVMGDSWSPIRTSLDNSFAKSVVNGMRLSNNTSNDGGKNNERRPSIGMKRSGSLSPIRGRSSNSLSPKKLSPRKATSKSPTRRSSPKRSQSRSKSPIRSPARSPLGDISPNRSPNRGRSPKRATSPKRGSATSMILPKKKALSPNGTYSLKEAEGTSFSMPTAETTNSESGSGSNMSVSSGSETVASSATLLTQTQTQITSKVTLPTLLSGHRGLQNAEIVPRNASTVASSNEEDDTEMVMLSPEKNSTKNHVRSPAPTPNSQRRVIKRFRSSVPSAKYLMPEEDLLEDSMEKNPNRKDDAVAEPDNNVHIGEETAKACNDSSQVAKPIDTEETTMPTYENAFEFPSDSIPVPRTKTLSLFHDQAISNGSPSHQYQLNRAGTNLLSLQEVILPSIAYETNAVLKQKQAKAQRYAHDGMPDSQGKDAVKAIETCRKVVTKCTGEAMKVAGGAWREREKERERLRVECLDKKEEQQRLDELNAKKERREARARSRQQRYERQKREKQRNHPRNKEMWQEVAKLMVDIQKLEKEERLWKEASVEVNRLEEHHQPPERMELDSIVQTKVDDQLESCVEGADLESTATTLVEDVTMATERINWMLKSVSLAMEESDKLRKEAYEKYQYDGHKFYGYPKADDSKGLFMALSMDSPWRGR